MQFVYQKGIAYGYQMGLRPQTLYGIADSPVGLAAYFLITIAWLTNTALYGARLYWENWGKLGYFIVKGV